MTAFLAIITSTLGSREGCSRRILLTGALFAVKQRDISN